MISITPNNWKKVFFLIWSGQAVSLVGSQLIHFSIAWWLTQTTGSAAILVTVPLFAMVPQIFLGPFIGALVDRWDRRRVMIIADSLIALFTAWLVVMFLTGVVEIWHLFVLSFVRGIGGAFHWPAMQASTSLMVPKEQLARVAGMNQTLQGVLNIASPPLGALLVGFMPMWGIMLIDLVTAAFAVIPLLFIKIPRPQIDVNEVVTPRSVLRDVAAGLRYVGSWPAMMMLLGMAMVINFLLTPAGTLLPLLVTRHFGGNAWHFSALESAFGFGMIGGGLLLSTWGGFKRKVVTSMAGITMLGIACLMVGLAPSTLFLLVVAGQGLSGLLHPLINGPLMALVQEHVIPEMQGRVFTLISSLSGAISPLGLAAAAPVADNLGIQTWFWVGGIVCLVLGGLSFFVPTIMNFERDAPKYSKPKQTDILPAD